MPMVQVDVSQILCYPKSPLTTHSDKHHISCIEGVHEVLRIIETVVNNDGDRLLYGDQEMYITERLKMRQNEILTLAIVDCRYRDHRSLN